MKIKEFEECFVGMIMFTERAVERLKKNDASLKDAEGHLDAEKRYANPARTEKAQAEYTLSKYEHTTVKGKVLEEFENKAKEMRKKLAKLDSESLTIRASDIDSDAERLLSLGLLNIEEIRAMAARFYGNPTMTRLILKHVSAMKGNDNHEAAALSGLKDALQSTDQGRGKLEAFDRLLSRCRKAIENPYSTSYIKSMKTICADVIDRLHENPITQERIED